ncbi:CDP-glycerol glycerophosphotransferase family protein [Eubacterium coprostanoligenes]|uniref:bifunctional glycosyltransferase/CDP-glycerol:glycerophosphate glycerophosphotransferase n=1 Tax=Eubacterium coprostanoligenes TaxID=290054 RepID=UPI002A832B13|nr:CDP-glycerol glycerophosphotransferase family protein [Eubacterium coprostanoligenes]MDY4698348.1 CDP-glycerol glycerophosphotransferase family protein [Eubacterium coprostanoligenes]
MSKNEHKFLFSVIMPIYNVEDYIEEAISSLVNQTIGFDKIQIIMINDGSPDNSEAVCLKYKEQYPDNIVYKKIPNGGVSNARNTAFQYVDAKYITFLDPDDKWELSSFENAYKFFEEHYDEIDVLASRIKFFEGCNYFHSLDYKFQNGTRIFDLENKEELFSIQPTAKTTFIKSDALGDIRFDSRLKIGEEFVFINKIMLKKKKLGLICESLYFYRRRNQGDSSSSNRILDKSFYINSLVYYHMELMKYCEEMYGEVILYVQSMIAYDLFWRIGYDHYLKVLDEKEQREYFELAKILLGKIDDYILLNNPKHKTMYKRNEAFKIKYGKELFELIDFDAESGSLYYEDAWSLVLPKQKGIVCEIASLGIKDDNIFVDVFVAQWIFRCTKNGEVKFKLRFGNQEATPELVPYDPYNVVKKTGHASYHYVCKCKFDLKYVNESGTAFKPYFSFGEKETSVSMSYSKFVPTRNLFRPSYKAYGKYIVRCMRKAIKVSVPKDLKAYVENAEKACVDYLKEIGRDDLAEIRAGFPKFKKEQEKKGSVWLFSDRIDNAGDSGEVVFKYICEHTPKGVRPIFTIGRAASDEVKNRLEAIGEVVYFEDTEFKYYFLLADKIVSSSAGEFTINAFEDDRPYFVDMYHFDFYFMNHGVNCGDCSAWLNHYNKNIKIFFNTGVNERQAIIDGRYNMTADQCVITGLPRFDALYDDRKKQLLVLPSWRKSIKGAYDDKTSSVYYDGFVNTDYYKFYNGLINDERLLAKMREKGYTGLFCLHPIFRKQAVDFKKNDVFAINEGFINYNKVFAESSVMVTDYSTIAFDFAYLKKPIVYTQFDKEEFYKTQTYDKGFFEYERDGFGPVCYDLDSAVDALIKIIDKDCENDYIDRVTNFFVNIDKNNSKRVIDTVLADSKKEEKPSFFKRLFSRK